MEIFDKTASLEKAGDDPELAKELFQMLINALPELKATLNQEFQHSANGNFLAIAHKVYGSTAYCGVPQLRESAKSLEDVIKAGNDAVEVESQLELVNQAIDRLMGESDVLLASDW